MDLKVEHRPDAHAASHLAEAVKVLRLPREVSGLRWHPFGVYVAPLARRIDGDTTWSRRLHVWHPTADPVGEASPYGVHTHSGDAQSHVLAGALFHHLYAFEPDADGAWDRAALGTPEGTARLIGHACEETPAGSTHALPANQPHGVTKPPGLAVSLFEQVGGQGTQPFTTWQRNDVPEVPLVRQAPAPIRQVQNDALLALEPLLAVTP